MPTKIKDNILVVDRDSYPYMYEENVTIPLKFNNGLVRANLYRPKNVDKAPVLLTYGPYGKDVPYEM